jgi:hypothetical protein
VPADDINSRLGVAPLPAVVDRLARPPVRAPSGVSPLVRVRDLSTALSAVRPAPQIFADRLPGVALVNPLE